MGTDDFHTGSGDILLLRDPEGMIILRFQDYDVCNGPDLHVYLTPDPDGDVHADGAIDLGEVRATSGNVNYVVPEGGRPDDLPLGRDLLHAALGHLCHRLADTELGAAPTGEYQGAAEQGQQKRAAAQPARQSGDQRGVGARLLLQHEDRYRRVRRLRLLDDHVLADR